MKLEIYKPTEKPEPVEEPIRLALKELTTDGVHLVVVDKDGCTISGGNILKITNKGTIIRCQFIDDGLGFRLDTSTKVIVEH